MADDLTLSPAGRAAIMQREGYLESAAPDSGGLAIGYGMHEFEGKPVVAGQKATREALDKDFDRQIASRYAPAVRKQLRVPVSQDQFDALVSVEYNHPATATHVIEKLNRGDKLTADDFTASATVNGQPHKGLHNRRMQEFAPFQSQSTGSTGGHVPEQMPQEAKEFIDWATSQGYDEKSIMAALDKKYPRAASSSQTPADKKVVAPVDKADIPYGDPRGFTPIPSNRWDAFRQGADMATGRLAEGVVNAPRNALRGVLRMATQPPTQTLNEMVEGVKSIPTAIRMAGSNPERFGRQVGDTAAQVVMAKAAPEAYAKIPEGTIPGAVIGGMYKGIPGAIEGALGGGVGSRILRGFGDLIKKRGETPTRPPTPSRGPVPVREGVIVEPPGPKPPAEDIIEGEVIQTPPEVRPDRLLNPGASRVITTPPPETGVGPTRVPSDDPSFVRSVPAQPADRVARPALPAGAERITELPPSSTPDSSFVRGVQAGKTDVPVRDPATGRMKRVYTGEQTTRPAAPATPAQAFAAKVKDLAAKGYGAEDIATQLKDDPAVLGKSKAERINLVREARGGPSGQLPARVKQAVDNALSKLKTAEDKRAYLLKAPNAAVYDYIKSKIGV